MQWARDASRGHLRISSFWFNEDSNFRTWTGFQSATPRQTEEFLICAIVSKTSRTEGSSASLLDYYLLGKLSYCKGKSSTPQTKYVQMKSDFNPIKTCIFYLSGKHRVISQNCKYWSQLIMQAITLYSHFCAACSIRKTEVSEHAHF